MILTQKPIALQLLLGAYRLSTICMFTVDNINLNNILVNDILVTFLTNKVLGHSRKGIPLKKFEHIAYKDKRLCVIA